jgi:hypothetical protein
MHTRLGSKPGRIGTFPPARFGAAFTRSKPLATTAPRAAVIPVHPRPRADAEIIAPATSNQERFP